MKEPWCFKAASTYLFCGTIDELLTLFSLGVSFLLLVTFLATFFAVVSILLNSLTFQLFKYSLYLALMRLLFLVIADADEE